MYANVNMCVEQILPPLSKGLSLLHEFSQNFEFGLDISGMRILCHSACYLRVDWHLMVASFFSINSSGLRKLGVSAHIGSGAGWGRLGQAGRLAQIRFWRIWRFRWFRKYG